MAVNGDFKRWWINPEVLVDSALGDAVAEDHLVRKIAAAAEKLPLFAVRCRHSFSRTTDD